MLVDTVTRLIGNVGFPIVVALYLLWERRTLIKELTDAINALREAIEHMGPSP